MNLLIFSVLIGYCLAVPMAERITKVSKPESFKVEDYLVSKDIFSSSNTEQTGKEQIFVVDAKEYLNLDLYGVDYPILVTSDDKREWRFLSKPIPHFNSSGWFDWWGGDDDKDDGNKVDKTPSQAPNSGGGVGQSRYEVRGTSTEPFLLEPKLPISSCIDSTYGSGASVGKSISFSFNSGIAGDLNLGDTIISYLSWTVSYSISSSVSLSFSVSCSADAGESVQMFLAPWILEAETSYRETVEYEGVRLTASDWSEYLKSEWGISVPPETYCFTSSSQTCAIPGLDATLFHIDRITYV